MSQSFFLSTPKGFPFPFSCSNPSLSGLSIPHNQLSEYVDSAVMDGSVFDIHFKIPVYFFVGYKDYSSFSCNNSWYFSISRLFKYT